MNNAEAKYVSMVIVLVTKGRTLIIVQHICVCRHSDARVQVNVIHAHYSHTEILTHIRHHDLATIYLLNFVLFYLGTDGCQANRIKD